MQVTTCSTSIESASEGNRLTRKTNLCLSEQRPVAVEESLKDIRANQELVVQHSRNRLRTEARLEENA